MRISPKQKLSLGIGGVFALIIIVYAIFQFHDIIFGIRLTVVGITDGATYTGNKLTITGSAPKAGVITLNDRAISISKTGDFSEELLLIPGYSIITLKVKDKFKKEEIRIYHVFYQPEGITS